MNSTTVNHFIQYMREFHSRKLWDIEKIVKGLSKLKHLSICFLNSLNVLLVQYFSIWVATFLILPRATLYLKLAQIIIVRSREHGHSADLLCKFVIQNP